MITAFTGIAIIATGLLALIGLSETGSQGAGLLMPSDRKAVDRGREIYLSNCASCHGIDLQGQAENWRSLGPDGLMPAPPHDETGHTWHHPDELLFRITKLGIAEAANLANYRSAMPSYEGVLSDREIIDVLSYIKSTWPDEIRQRHDQSNERYALEQPASQ